MPLRAFRRDCFVLEGLNAFAASFFFNYLFFHCRDRFGFGNPGNLLLAAVHGLVYMSFVSGAGRFAQRRGCFVSVRRGFAVMGLAPALGGFFAGSAPAQVLVLAVWTWGMCYTWPALEALISEGASPEELPRLIGLYNLVWAGGAAAAFFTGGALLQALGAWSLYWLPAGLHATQLVLTARLARRQAGHGPGPATAAAPAAHRPEATAFQQPVRPETFLRMAWWANPFAYVAMNTVQPIIPLMARQLELSTAAAGVFASVWLFARLGTFALLWRWTGWHYRFRWLLAAFGLLTASLVALLLVRQLWWLVLAQAGFGLAVGLIYYSSLFYSMDLGEAKSEHGGLHEAAIGVGLFVGPAVGGAALYLAPTRPHAGVWAVGALLVVGLAGLAFLRLRQGRRS